MASNKDPFFKVVVEHRNAGKTLAEIAELTGAPLSRVNRAYYYAREFGYITPPKPTPSIHARNLARKGVFRRRGSIKEVIACLNRQHVDALATRAARKNQSLAEALGDLAAEVLDAEDPCSNGRQNGR